MTVETQVGGEPVLKSGPYAGDGVTATFDYDFPVQVAAELEVLRQNADLSVTTLARPADYTVSGVGSDAGGQITLVDPATDLPTGTNLLIRYAGDYMQLVDWSSQSAIQLTQLEQALDKQMMHIRTIKERIERTAQTDAFSATDVEALSDALTQLAAIEADISTVAGVSADVATVAGISADATTVAGVSADVTTVAGISADVTTVAGISADVTTVAGISADVVAAEANAIAAEDAADAAEAAQAAAESVAARQFDTVADMVASTTLIVGDIAETVGYLSVGDGGANKYEIVAAATGTDDGGSFIDLSGISGQAKGIFSGPPNPKQFGAAWDDATDDSAAVQAWVDYCGANNATGVFPAGVGRFTNITIDTTYQGLTLRGAGKRRTSAGTGATVLKNNAATPMFVMTGAGTSTGVRLSDVSFRQVDSSAGEFFTSTKSMSEFVLERFDWLLLNPSKGMLSITAPSISNIGLKRHYGTVAAACSVSPYYLQSQAGGSYFTNDYSDWFISSNATTTVPMLRLRDSSGGSTNGVQPFKNMVFELCASGGAIHASSIRHPILENVFCDDSVTKTAHLFLFDMDVEPGSQESAHITFIGCNSQEGDATWKDVRVESAGPGSQTVFINCDFTSVDVDGPPYLSVNSQISTDASGQPPMKILSGVLTVPETGNITFQEGMSVPEVQHGQSGVISAGGNEVITFANAFSNTPTVTVSHDGATDKGGSAQSSGASTTQVTVYNHGSASSIINWTAVADH